MGIKNLNNFLKKRCNIGIEQIHLKKYKNKTIAIDTSIFLYKFIYNGNYIKGFMQQILRLWMNSITPIYVFDGKPPDLKDRTINKRKEIKQHYIERINSLEEENKELMDDPDDLINLEKFKENEEKIKKINRNNIQVTHEHIENIKNLFDILGITYIVAETEADILCRNLCSEKLIDACISEDMDFLTHNCPYILRNFNYNSNLITEYKLKDILSDLSLDNDQFMDMCILFGCDYTDKIVGIGPVNAYKMIKKYGNIETILGNLDNRKYSVPEVFNYIGSREIFRKVEQCMVETNDFKPKKIKTEELKIYLRSNNFPEKLFDKIIKYNKNIKHGKITGFFTPKHR